ncbi:uncharacterized protein LOC143896633 [Temnothorax americanus]|uniref:uncharacterized protein LOC143896633 n=1 Tax=Temnothorax americanus TaxID=1964332 RepID=UPI004068B73A
MVAAGNVRPLNRRLSESYATPTPLLAEKMRSCTLIFVALATVLLCIEYAKAQEICPQENCIVPDECEELVKSDTSCQQQGTLCCSVVKSEFRTHCRHHGGICANSCPPNLKHETDDCTDGQVCCVLV